MSFAGIVRRYGLLALGLVAMIVGAVLLVVGLQPTSSFGWTAYAPLSHTVYRPTPTVTPLFLIGAALAGAGLALTATGIWQAVARRRPAVPPSA